MSPASGIARTWLIVLAGLGLCRAGVAQESDTHPAEVLGVWAHEEAPDRAGLVEWAVIQFGGDGSYRAARVSVGRERAERVGETVIGQWAVVRTEARGPVLCSRPQGAEYSRCNPYSLNRSPRSLRWSDLSFVPADSALLARLGLAEF